MTFQDVKVFAGDKFLPAADVAYNNLTWDITATLSEASSTSDGPGGIQSTATPREGSSTSEGPGGIQSTATTSEGLSGVVEKDNEIGTIESWGPHFRVSFEMIIKSFVGAKWTNILSFKGNGATSECCQPGDRAPAVFLQEHKKLLVFSNTVNGNGGYAFHWNKKVELNKWYKIIIEQISINGKVKG